MKLKLIVKQMLAETIILFCIMHMKLFFLRKYRRNDLINQ